DELVDVLGHDVFLQHQLDAVGEALKQAEGAVHVGPDAVLHAGDHTALEPDVEEREDHQDHERQDDLDDDDPPGVVAEDGEVVGRGERHWLQHHASPPLTVTGDPAAARRSRRRLTPLLLAGTQTTWSAMSPAFAGRLTDPLS